LRIVGYSASAGWRLGSLVRLFCMGQLRRRLEPQEDSQRAAEDRMQRECGQAYLGF
jgi:hypothetical protein